jgi:hypothetical protein
MFPRKYIDMGVWCGKERSKPARAGSMIVGAISRDPETCRRKFKAANIPVKVAQYVSLESLCRFVIGLV